ncbi:MAG: ABC transporter ATP-binding protein [Bradyrhizobiaceae bacterium]|nr:MAG: ABC transporter ATP-binding protein [Bradyrhizobiaceae bacterium]
MSGAASAPLMRIETVSKRFGGFTAVDGVSLQIGAGEFFALLGPSGCGKTTLLRMLAGFEMPDEGGIWLDGENIAEVPPHLRPVNMMFQNYALFPHLSVEANIAFGLKRAGLAKDEIAARVAEMVALVRLQGLERRKPDQLSGGQRQRVALARALARRPRLLLLDEPLAALDKKLRAETQAELIQVQRRLGMSFIIVTHDQEEAMTLADRIGVMNQGRLVQVAAPRTLYERPDTRWIAGFVGDINLFAGQVMSQGSGCVTVATPSAGVLRVAGEVAAGQAVSIAVRPEKLSLSHDMSSGEVNAQPGEVVDADYLGGLTRYRVKLAGGDVVQVARANAAGSEVAFEAGQQVMVSFAPEDAVVLTQ